MGRWFSRMGPKSLKVTSPRDQKVVDETAKDQNVPEIY